jgi:hypothetical protein
MGSYGIRPERLAVSSRLAKLRKSLRVMTLWRWYVYETLLKRLTQHLQNMAAALRQLVQEEHPVVRQRHVAGHGHLSPANQPHIGDGADAAGSALPQDGMLAGSPDQNSSPNKALTSCRSAVSKPLVNQPYTSVGNCRASSRLPLARQLSR